MCDGLTSGAGGDAKNGEEHGEDGSGVGPREVLQNVTECDRM
jgi:hypothetical protein